MASKNTPKAAEPEAKAAPAPEEKSGERTFTLDPGATTAVICGTKALFVGKGVKSVTLTVQE